MKNKIKVAASDLVFRAEFKPQTYNKEKRTVDVVWAKGAKVKRYDWWEDRYFWEELGMDPSEIRMDRLNAGASVLNNHNSWDLRDILGVVENAAIKNGEGLATVRFSEREEIKGLVKDIQDGIIRNLSVGYKVHRFEEQKDMIDGIPVMRAVDWEPCEISFVGIPADQGAQVRSENKDQNAERYIEAVLTRREENMGQKNKKPTVSASGSTTTKRQDEPQTETPAETPVVQASAEAQVPSTEASAEQPQQPDQAQPESEAPAETPVQPEGEQPPSEEGGESGQRSQETSPDQAEQIRAAEQKRGSEIRSLVRIAQLDEKFADELIANSKVQVEDARKAIFAELEKRTSVQTKNGGIQVKDIDQKQNRKDAATKALLHRFDPTKYQAKEGETQEFRQGSLIDMARHFLFLEGNRDAYTMSRSEVAKRSLHTTSDFAEVLANVANKTLRDAYQGAPNTYEPFVQSRNVADFKEITSLQLGNGGKLQKVNESGEYKRTSVSESAEKYKVEKYGLVIGKTYELMINDDLDAFTRIPTQLGIRAREKENEIFWSLVIANGLMSETGQALFSTAHTNLTGTGTAISVASLGIMRSRMRVQKDLDGELMNLSPAYIVTPAALETVAEQFISQSILADEAAKTNPFYQKLKHIVEPRLDAASATAWYVFANKAQQAIGEMALLDGKGPEMFTREGFDVDGMELKIRHHFGMKIVDFRGAQKNNGA